MTPTILRYPLDPTGTSVDNLVQNELHTMPRRKIRAIATTYGAFFSESLVVIDTSTNKQLVRGTQFYPAELYELPTARYGKEICAIIVITDEAVGDEVAIQYQVVGGEFSGSMQAIIQQIENLSLDGRSVSWPNIIGKPSEFPPSHHLHDVGDVYGFEYVVHAIDRVRSAIEMGDSISHDTIYQYIDGRVDGMIAGIAQNTADLARHVANTSNPHNTTAAQLNAYTKPEVNALLSTSVNDAKAELNARIDKLMTDTTNSDATTANALNLHVSNQNNPHRTTAAQVGAYTTAQTDAAITSSVGTAVNAAKTELINRFDTADTALGGRIDTVSASVTRVNAEFKIYTTTGANNAYVLTPDFAVNNSAAPGRFIVKFHASNNNAYCSLKVGSAPVGNLYTLDSNGNRQWPNLRTNQIGEVMFDGTDWLIIDSLPPAIPPTPIQIYGATPTSRQPWDYIFVYELGVLNWVQTNSFWGYRHMRCGELIFDTARWGRNGWVDATGGYLNKQQFAALWGFAVDHGLVTSAAGWRWGNFHFADIDANTFRLPDMQEIFVRGVGSTREFSTFQWSANQSHTHAVSTEAAGAHNHGSGWGEQNNGRHGIYDATRGIGSGSTDNDNPEHLTSWNGTHSHNGITDFGSNSAGESRPINVALVPRIHI